MRTRTGAAWATAAGALAGIAAAQALLNWIIVIERPRNFGGKPFWAWASFSPITFALMVLFGAIGTAVVAIRAGKRDTIPQPPPMLIKTGATVDKFVVWISATDPKFDEDKVIAFVESIGAAGVKLVDAKEEDHAE